MNNLTKHHGAGPNAAASVCSRACAAEFCWACGMNWDWRREVKSKLKRQH